jgi:uncharacterized protein YvpB
MKPARLWNTLTCLTLGLSGLVIAVTAWLLFDPPGVFHPAAVSSALLAPLTPTAPPSREPYVFSESHLSYAPAPAYPTLPPAWTKTHTPPPTFTRTPRPTATPSLTSTSTPTLTPTPTLLGEARISGIVGHRQALSLSCESRSASDWAAYFGIGVDEKEFFGRLPVSDDPDVGFVGDVNGDWGYLPPGAYGVYAGPVASLLQAYGAKALAARGLTWDDLKEEIIENRPVIVWVVGHVGESTPVPYTAQDGHTTTVARYEHTVILIGYTPTRVIILDGENVYTRPTETFMKSWSVLGNMAILWQS